MKKNINPNLLVDETGIKNLKEDYTCDLCNKKKPRNKIQSIGWYYKINKKEKDLIHLEKNKIGYVHIDNVTYICNEDYKKLTAEKASDFVEIGLPYFISLDGQNGGIFSF